MAKKTSRAKGKAAKKRAKPKAFSAELIPFRPKRLTPAAATKWLAEEHFGFQELASLGLRLAKGKGQIEAFELLSLDVGYFVQACATAIRSGEPVLVNSLSGWTQKDALVVLPNVMHLLVFPVLAAAHDHDVLGDTPESRAFAQIYRDAQRIVVLVAREHTEKWIPPGTVIREAEETLRLYTARLAEIAEAEAAAIDPVEKRAKEVISGLTQLAEAKFAARNENLEWERRKLEHEAGAGVVQKPFTEPPPKGYVPELLGGEAAQ